MLMLDPNQPLPFVVENLLEMVREPLLVLDSELRVQRANQSFHGLCGTTPEESAGKRIYEVANQQWDIPALRQLLETLLPESGAVSGWEIAHVFPSSGRKVLSVNARRIQDGPTGTEFTLIV